MRLELDSHGGARAFCDKHLQGHGGWLGGAVLEVDKGVQVIPSSTDPGKEQPIGHGVGAGSIGHQVMGGLTGGGFYQTGNVSCRRNPAGSGENLA